MVDGAPSSNPQPSKQNLQVHDGIWLSLLLVIHSAMLAWGAFWHSPTVDEPAYLASGVSHWVFGRFDLCKVSPPLVRLVAAIPVCLTPHESNWDSYRVGPGVRVEHAVGRNFVAANGRGSFWLFTIGRWACIPFSLIGALVCYAWSREVWGRRSAFAAALIWCSSPNILAHGQMLTPDIGVTALSLAASFAYWRWSQQPTWVRTAIAGAVLGLAVLAKTNAVVLLAILPTLGMITQVGKGRRDLQHALAQMTVSLVVAIYTLNLIYAFEGSCQPLGRYKFVSNTFCGDGVSPGNRFLGTWLEHCPMPCPTAFLEGIDLQRKDFENAAGKTMTYWRGDWYDHSWWWYYLYATLVKSTVGMMALMLVAAVVQMSQGFRSWFSSALLFTIVPAVSLFAFASSQTGFGHSVRYVIPAFPFAFVFASSAFRDLTRWKWLNLLSAAALVCHIVSSVAVFPHSLSYFNEPSGGPRNGHFHLLDGNLDWGQDLLLLDQWIQSHPEARPINVAYWGFLPLKDIQMDLSQFQFQDKGDKTQLPGGWYAISVNHLRREFRSGDPKYERFLARTPVALVGYSIYVYHVEEPLPP